MTTLLRRLQRTGLSDPSELFIPTTGRWLWNERRRQQEHTRTFNLKALEDVVLKAAGPVAGAALDRFEKLAEGGTNKVFLAVVGKQRLIVKIPDPVHPPRLVTASEVATLDFLRSELELPVPRVFSWSDCSDNPVGCEYVVMEEAQGRPLNMEWSIFDHRAKFLVVDEILSIQKRLLSVQSTFSGYGSLYFSGDTARLGISRHLPLSSVGAQKYCIGPLTHQHFIGTGIAASGVDCGPWNNPQEYLTSNARSSMAQIVLNQGPDKRSDEAFTFPVNTVSDNSATAVTEMLETLCTAIPYLIPRSVSQNQPLLWHPDLHHGNIFVLPDGKISCLIDWQDANILPTFLAARVPQFIQVDDEEILLELPEDPSSVPEARQLEVWERFLQSMCQHYYLLDLQDSEPDLKALLEDRELAPLRKQIAFHSRMSSNRDVDATFLRDTLFRIQKRWSFFISEKDVGLPCPINIESDELERHQRDGKYYNEFQDLLQACNIPVSRDGWVPMDEFALQRRALKLAIRKEIDSFVTPSELLEFERKLDQWKLAD